jgi:hypothetical protein
MNTDNQDNNTEDTESSEKEPSTIDRLKQWLSENGQSLEGAGVAVIEGTYHGDGDEGNFDSVVTLDAQRLPVSFNVPHRVVKLIELLADELAPAGYEDGDGGGGEIRLHVDTGSITHQAYFFSIERTYEEEETY